MLLFTSWPATRSAMHRNHAFAWFRAEILGFSVTCGHKKHLAEYYQWTVTAQSVMYSIIIHLHAYYFVLWYHVSDKMQAYKTHKSENPPVIYGNSTGKIHFSITIVQYTILLKATNGKKLRVFSMGSCVPTEKTSIIFRNKRRLLLWNSRKCTALETIMYM